MFKKPTYKNPQDYKKEVNQDTLVMVNTIHDEVNFGVDSFLIKPLLKKIIMLGTAKNIINQFGYPYMNFLYDVEFSDTGEFTGENCEGVKALSVYEVPKHLEEHTAKVRYNDIIKLLSPKPDVKAKEITVSYKDFLALHTKGLVKKYITDSKKDVCTLVIVDGATKYQHTVKNSFLKLLSNKKITYTSN